MDATHLDGNAMGGTLWEAFGIDMTGRKGRCSACGAINAMGALLAFVGGPGDVMRCPSCLTVLMVAVEMPGRLRISIGSLQWLEITPA